jgi:hypothetical protein
MPATMTSKINRSSNEVQMDRPKIVIGMFARASDLGLGVGVGDGDALGEAPGDGATEGEGEPAGEITVDAVGDCAGDAAAATELAGAGVGEVVGVGFGVGGRQSQYPRFLASTSSSFSSASLGHGVGGQILKSMSASRIAKNT